MTRNSAGARKPYNIDLTKAREGKKYDAKGRYIKIADASDTNAEIKIAIGDNNFPSQYETLKKNGEIFDAQGFDVFYVSNTAQSGKSVRLIVSEGPDDYTVNNPTFGVIDSVGSIDYPVEIIDDDILSAIGLITTTLKDFNIKASGLHKVGANQARVTGTATDEVLIDGTTDNPSSGDGVIIRTFSTYAGTGGSLNILKLNGTIIGELFGTTNSAHIGFPLPMKLNPGDQLTVTHGAGYSGTTVTWDEI